MHILIVNHHMLDTPGGSETQCHEVASQLLQLGHTVTYGVCRPGRHSYDVPYATHPLRGSLPAALSAALAELEPDVVYWRRNKPYLLRCVSAARRHGVKFVFGVSSSVDVRVFTKRRFPDERVNLLRRTGRALAQLGAAARGAMNYFALSLVDGIVFQHSGQVPRGFNGRYEIIYNSYPRIEVAAGPPSTRYVLWVGNLKKIKNPEYFLRLASDLEDTGVEFWMVGGIQNDAYRRLLGDASSLPKSFRYLGFQNQSAINSLMKGSLFLVSTSAHEGFPNVFIQAWLQRKAVVSLYVDPGELLVKERIGLCSGDYETFKADVARLIADPGLRESIGERGFQFAAANCNPEINVKRLERFLVKIASGRD